MGSNFELFAGKLASVCANYKKAEGYLEGGGFVANGETSDCDEDNIHEMDHVKLLFGDDVDFGMDVDGNIIKHDGSYIGGKTKKVRDIETGKMVEADDDVYDEYMGKSSFRSNVKLYGDDVGVSGALGRWGNDSGTFHATIGEGHLYAGWEITADVTAQGSVGLGLGAS